MIIWRVQDEIKRLLFFILVHALFFLCSIITEAITHGAIRLSDSQSVAVCSCPHPKELYLTPVRQGFCDGLNPVFMSAS